MSKVKVNKEFDGKKLRAIINEKGIKPSVFAESCGIGRSTLDKYIQFNEAPVTIIKLFCLTLGIDEKELEPVKEPVVTKSAAQIIADSETEKKVDELTRKMERMERELQMMAKVLINIRKICSEAKAQSELNHEELTACINKVTGVSSNVAKIYGKVVKHL